MSEHQKAYCSSLVDLMQGIAPVADNGMVTVSGLQLDSRKVIEGDLFIAETTELSLVEQYMQAAIKSGASAVVVDQQLVEKITFESSVPLVAVQGLKGKIGVIADRFYHSPSQALSVIGVTGTNGKTSVSNYAASMMSFTGMTSGVIGTLGYGVSAEPLINTGYTTPDVVSVHQCLAELKSAGADCVVMEVSSHGLEQGRVDGVRFEGAVFTNLSREHLDYHGSMAQYAAAKCKLFERAELKFAVINGDDAYAEQFNAALASSVRVIRYGFSSCFDVHVSKVSYQKGIDALIQTPIGELKIQSELLGHFNLSNLLAVIAIGVAKGLSLDELKSVEGLRAVPGRMQLLRAEDKPTVIVDYAHTPDALANALSALELHCSGSLNVVFGCGGDRDTGKRAEMAAVAEKYAQSIYVTDDNPRTESPEKIVQDIVAGFSKAANIKVIHNRAEAIDLAIEESEQDDWLLIAGKGHESYQEISGSRLPFSDVEVASRKLGIAVNGVAL